MTTATAATGHRARKRKRSNADGVQPSPYSFSLAWKNGDVLTRLSLCIFGLGDLARKQIVKGLAFLASEVLLILYLVEKGGTYLGKLPTLGSAKQTKVKVNGFWVYQAGDNSVVILLYGVMSVFVILLLILLATR